MNEIKLNNIEERLAVIEKRNVRVELEKKWETSLTRKLLIIAFTYVGLGTYMYAIGVEKPLVNAVVPTCGFYLSTLGLSFFKSLWLKHINK